MFKLDYNITKINFYLYLYNNEIYNDEKMEYLKKILFNNKKLNLIYFLLYKYMADYYRKTVNNTVNDVKLKMQMSAFTLKLSENINKIDNLIQKDNEINKNLKNNVALINSNKDIIETNKNNISENLELINKKSDIIESNRNGISENLNSINLIKPKISSNYALSNIKKSKLDLKSDIIDKQTSKLNEIDTNLININTNISNNTCNITGNLNKLNEILELLKNKIPQKTFNKIFDIENKEFNFNRTSHFFEIFSPNIENDFIKDDELRISSKIYYKYKNLSNDITRLCHEYQLYFKDGLIHTLIFTYQFFGEANYTNNILYIKEDFYIKLVDDYSKLKIILMLHRVNRNGVGAINLETYNNNSTNVSFIENPIA